jgi:hypothetical protein
MLSTVAEFFRQRAGLFFVLLAVLFGFLRSAEHYAFAVFFLTGSKGMLYLGVVWLAYTLLCAQFLSRLWQRQEYAFIYAARLWNPSVRMFRFVLMAVGLLQPLFYYGIYLVAIAIQDKLVAGLWPIIPYYVGLITLIALTAEWRIRSPQVFVETKNSQLIKWPFKRKASLTLWSIEWLFREKGVTLLAGKLGAILVTLGTLLYYSTDDYDIRLPAVGLSLAYLLNMGISYELYKWESETWLWGRSLPVSRARRMVRILLIHAIIIIPETLTGIRNGALTFLETIQLYALGLSILVAVHLFFYKKRGLLEDSMQTALFGFIGLTLLILYKIPILILAGVFLSASILMYSRWHKA